MQGFKTSRSNTWNGTIECLVGIGQALGTTFFSGPCTSPYYSPLSMFLHGYFVSRTTHFGSHMVFVFVGCWPHQWKRCQFCAFTHREARVQLSFDLQDYASSCPKMGSKSLLPLVNLCIFSALLLDFSNVLTYLQMIVRSSSLNSGWQWRKKPVLVSSCDWVLLWKWILYVSLRVYPFQTHTHISSRVAELYSVKFTWYVYHYIHMLYSSNNLILSYLHLDIPIRIPPFTSHYNHHRIISPLVPAQHRSIPMAPVELPQTPKVPWPRSFWFSEIHTYVTSPKKLKNQFQCLNVPDAVLLK